jgi:hypothetical protein
MAGQSLRRRATALGAIGLLGLSLLGSLILMSVALQNSARFGALYSILLLCNTAGLIAFIALIGLNLRHLVRQLRRHEPGARLTLRMLIIFVTLAVTPVIVLYGFSLDYLRRGIDGWFDVRIEQALADALELSREALDVRMRGFLSRSEAMAEELAQGSMERSTLNLDALRRPDSIVSATSWVPSPSVLDALREQSGADELTLLSGEGELLASSSRLTDLIPHLPPEAVLIQARQGQTYIGLDPLRDGDLFVRLAIGVGGAAAYAAFCTLSIHSTPASTNSHAGSTRPMPATTNWPTCATNSSSPSRCRSHWCCCSASSPRCGRRSIRRDASPHRYATSPRARRRWRRATTP